MCLPMLEKKGQEQADKQHVSFTANVNELKQALPDDAGVAAVAAFLASAEEKKAKSCRPQIGRNVPKLKAVISASA